MLKRLTAVVGCSLLMVGAVASNAWADIFTIVCPIEVSIGFSPGITSGAGSSDYSISLSGIDVVPGGGQQSCASSLGLTDIYSTAGGGDGHGIVWTCEAALGTGTWSQGFGGNEPPSGLNGTHVITGTWDAWTLQLVSDTVTPVVVGTAELTLAPTENLKRAQCATFATSGPNAAASGGVSSLNMVGVLVIQDP